MKRINSKIKEKITTPYKKRRTLVDIKFLKRIRNYRIYLIIFLIGTMFYLLNKKYFVFLTLTLLSSFFSFYHSKYNRTPVDFKLSLFLGIFFTRNYGLLFTFIFFIISDTVPALLGGESIKGADLLFYSWYFIINSIVLVFPTTSLLILGPVLVVIESIGSMFINNFFGIPFVLSFLVSILNTLTRIIYFTTLGRILEVLL